MLDLNKKYTLNNRATDLIILATCLEEILLWFSSVRTTMERSDQSVCVVWDTWMLQYDV